MIRVFSAGLAACVLYAGCTGSIPEQAAADASADLLPADSSPADVTPAETTPDAREDSLCAPPAGLSGTPSSIADVVALANAMLARQPSGQGLLLPCFLQSLARPLAVLASSGPFSAQPAVGQRSPRIFLFSGNLVLSVATEGLGSDVLELAEYVTTTRSIKGEVAFPVEAPLSPAAPYDHVLEPTGTPTTRCALCHSPEEPVSGDGSLNRYISDVIRPAADEVVALPFVDAQRTACDPRQEPWRCLILSAVFGHGPVTQGSFSKDARTIY
ncbi:MAG: hypothetical protein ABIS92_17870 [Polyangia bacterium]